MPPITEAVDMRSREVSSKTASVFAFEPIVACVGQHSQSVREPPRLSSPALRAPHTLVRLETIAECSVERLLRYSSCYENLVDALRNFPAAVNLWLPEGRTESNGNQIRDLVPTLAPNTDQSRLTSSVSVQARRQDEWLERHCYAASAHHPAYSKRGLSG